MEEIQIRIGPIVLQGLLEIPKDATKCVLFAHGSGSSRLSPRNQYVAKVLNHGGIATLLMDLLTPEEEQIDESTRALRFDIPKLTERLSQVTQWAEKQEKLKMMSISYFGASTGAAAALLAATKHPEIKAVVSRGGRPDLAAAQLPQVKAKTLFIVGGNDCGVIELNEQAFAMLTCEKQLIVVPGGSLRINHEAKI